MKSILITGAGGYVGTKLCAKLVNEGFKIYALDTFWFGNFLKENNYLTVITHDIRNKFNFEIPKLDFVIHLAAISNDLLSDLESDLSWETGCLGSLNTLEFATKHKIKKFIYASSGSVYGISSNKKVIENTELKPISLYNKIKMITEKIVLNFRDHFEINILRPATVCGWSPRMRLDLSVNALTFAALNNKKMIVDGGDQIRPHVHIDDLVDAYLFFIQNSFTENIFNVGFENLTINELAQKIAFLTDSIISYSEIKDIRSYNLDSSLLLDKGFKPRKNIVHAINELKIKFDSGELDNDERWYSTTYLRKILS